jgi:hypothetical protein
MIRRRWPEWWNWDLEFTPHLFKRMADREFSEVNLRSMLENARGYRPDIVEGRWVIVTRHRNTTWEVIVEPDTDMVRLVVITAYPLGDT